MASLAKSTAASLDRCIRVAQRNKHDFVAQMLGVAKNYELTGRVDRELLLSGGKRKGLSVCAKHSNKETKKWLKRLSQVASEQAMELKRTQKALNRNGAQGPQLELAATSIPLRDHAGASARRSQPVEGSSPKHRAELLARQAAVAQLVPGAHLDTFLGLFQLIMSGPTVQVPPLPKPADSISDSNLDSARQHSDLDMVIWLTNERQNWACAIGAAATAAIVAGVPSPELVIVRIDGVINYCRLPVLNYTHQLEWHPLVELTPKAEAGQLG